MAILRPTSFLEPSGARYDADPEATRPPGLGEIRIPFERARRLARWERFRFPLNTRYHYLAGVPGYFTVFFLFEYFAVFGS